MTKWYERVLTQTSSQVNPRVEKEEKQEDANLPSANIPMSPSTHTGLHGYAHVILWWMWWSA